MLGLEKQQGKQRNHCPHNIQSNEEDLINVKKINIFGQTRLEGGLFR